MPLRWVRAELAGPRALGLLVPPGSRTVLVLRPRSLAWDLVLLEGLAGDRFREMSQEQAQAVTQAVGRALDRWACGGRGHVSAVPASGPEFHIWVDLDEFALVLCAREPGRPYRPLTFASPELAQPALAALAEVLPPADGQEAYVNTRGFAPVNPSP